MKKLISAMVAGLFLSALAPLAIANAEDTTTLTDRSTCCTPQGCGICIP